MRLFILHNPTVFSNDRIMKKYLNLFFGAAVGFLNGLFGSGGGTVAVPCLEKSGVEPKKAHAASVALIFVLSIVTAVVYFFNGKLDFNGALQYIPYGLIGAVIGALLLRKIPDKMIRKIFGVLIIASAIRMFI